jgi:hypothetical protein
MAIEWALKPDRAEFDEVQRCTLSSDVGEELDKAEDEEQE